MPRSIRFLAIALCLCLLAGCTPGPETPETAPTGQGETATESPGEDRAKSFGLTYQPEAGCNPYTCTRLANRPLISLMYQGLFSVTSQYRAEPVLCKRYSCTSDRKTYRFQLAEATFSDGAPLTAQDVAASLEAAKGSPVYGDRLRHVTKITPEGDQVTLTLDTPYDNLPVLLDIPIVRSGDVEAKEPLGTGPYAMDAGGTALNRRRDWWSEYPPAVEFDTIALSQTSTPSEIRDQFEFGQTDLVCGDPGSAAYVEYRCDYELWDCATGILLYLGCNRGGSSPFANGTVRAALTHGVDRAALMEVYRGFAQEAYLPASPEADCYDSALAASYGYDPAAFSGALGEAGLQNTTATLLVCSDQPVRVTAAQTVADGLTACGLEVTVNALEGEKYQEALQAGNFDFYLGEVRLSPNFDLSPFFQENGTLPYGGMSDPELYALCLKALENSGNYPALHEAVMESGQLCPLLFRTYAVFATRGTVSGLLPGLDSVFHTSNSRQLADARSEWEGPDLTTPPEETEAPTEEGQPEERETPTEEEWPEEPPEETPTEEELPEEPPGETPAEEDLPEEPTEEDTPGE